ncbi:UNVERIFIED_CONTAM: TetR family transcriptional regulator [Williamsia faeni]
MVLRYFHEVTTNTQPPPGRPRDPQKDVDVLQATRELLVEVGYQSTTIAAIARRSGVGAPTIYRRWARREALIEDAAFGKAEPGVVPEATGDLWEDFRAWSSIFLHQFANPVSRAAIPGLLSAYQQEEDLYARLVNRSEHDVRVLMRDLLSGYLPEMPGKALNHRSDAVFDFLVATTALRALTVGLADHEQFCDQTATALAALAYSTWKPQITRRRSRVE